MQSTVLLHDGPDWRPTELNKLVAVFFSFGGPEVCNEGVVVFGVREVATRKLVHLIHSLERVVRIGNYINRECGHIGHPLQEQS